MKPTLSIVAAIAIAVPFTWSNLANASTIDFNGFLAGTIIDSDIVGVTVSADTFNAADLDVAVIFDTASPTGGDTDLLAPFTGPLGMLSPEKVLILQESAPCSAVSCTTPDDVGRRPAGIFTFEFDSPITLVSIDFFDIENPEANPFSESNEIELFDIGNVQINDNAYHTPDTGGDNKWAQLGFNVSGVKEINIHMGGSGAIDNIIFNSAFTVPVPAAAWLFTSGLLTLIPLSKPRH